jgi:putative LysE/RhtB family amino acid efflux pump
MIEDFTKGALLGLAMAAPVGPIGLLCIRRTLESGFKAGVSGGLGTALADGVYAAIAAFGITAVATSLVAIQTPLQLIAIAVLIWLGIATIRRRPAVDPAPLTGGGALKLFAQTFALTLTNPATTLSFAALYAGFAGADARALVVGTFTGSLLWWVILSGVVAASRRRITPGAMIWINRFAGALFLAFAAAIAWALMSR